MQEAIRDAIVAFLNPLFASAHPLTPILYDNAPFDWNDPPPSFVQFEIEFTGGDQVGISVNPKTRLNGLVRVCVSAKNGRGTKTSYALLDWFGTTLAYQKIGFANFQSPEPEGSNDSGGYHHQHLKLYFYSDPS